MPQFTQRMHENIFCSIKEHYTSKLFLRYSHLAARLRMIRVAPSPAHASMASTRTYKSTRTSTCATLVLQCWGVTLVAAVGHHPP